MKFYHEKLLFYRKKSGLLAKAVCKKMGIGKTTLWSWENGKTIPAEAQIHKIAQLFNINITEISDLSAGNNISDQNLVRTDFDYIGENVKGLITKQNYFFDKIGAVNSELSMYAIAAQTLFKNLKIMFYIKGADSKYLIVNDFYKEIYALPDNYSIKGKSDIDILSRKDAVFNSKEDNQVLTTGVPVLNREDYIPGTKKRKWGIISKYPIHDFNGEVFGVLCAIVDITQRKKDEIVRELIEKKVYSMEDGFAVINTTSNNYLYMNKFIEKVYGYSLEQFYDGGGDFWLNTCVHPDDRQRESLYKSGIKKYPSVRKFRVITPSNSTHTVVSRKVARLEFLGKEYVSFIDIIISESK
jgi:PAS domain-containing protein